jgi:hypothetical protein
VNYEWWNRIEVDTRTVEEKETERNAAGVRVRARRRISRALGGMSVRVYPMAPLLKLVIAVKEKR